MRTISDVVERQLCSGCGACSVAEPDRFRMGDVYSLGRRPFAIEGASPESGLAFELCPGVSLSHSDSRKEHSEYIPDFFDGWGPVLSVWEGFAVDEKVRFEGSSGGAATALATYGLDVAGIERVLHTAASKLDPLLNETVFSSTSDELLARAGSRYAPSSPAEGLGELDRTSGRFLFIGKPCDVAAASNLRKWSSSIDDKLSITIAFFCAGVPSFEGNHRLLEREGLKDISKLRSIRYRGLGWPGLWRASWIADSGNEIEKTLTYAESWGYLQKYRQWRCYLCPDHTGEFADISVGDPWYRKISNQDKGRSLIVARTQKGLDFIVSAEKAGYIFLEKCDPALLPASQPNLLETKGMLWARLLVLRLFRIPVPTYKDFSLFRFWMSELSLKKKIQSFYGTVKRIYTKNLLKARLLEESDLRSKDLE